MEFSDNQDRIFVFGYYLYFIIVKAIKVRFMGDIIIVLLGILGCRQALEGRVWRFQ